ATSSIGKIVENYGYSTTAVKIDPYINFDAGTLRPTEHGEVWVTDDGGEIDQDLGNYERFLSKEIPKGNNITTGQVYKNVIDKERAGKYLGQTVQFIPHIPEEIIRRIKEASEGFDVCVVEIGGTIGDYENMPFLFAVRSLIRMEGKENLAIVMLSYLPVPSHDPIRRKKIETYANIEADYVISAPDTDCIYEVPINFEKENMGKKLLDKLNLSPRKKPDWSKWTELLDGIMNPRTTVNVAMVCKYLDIGKFSLKDSYISVSRALIDAGAGDKVGVNIKWIDSKDIEKEGTGVLGDVDGIIVPGGFGEEGFEGKIKSIQYARENKIPFLGLCLGMQLALVEFARNVMGLGRANTIEADPETPHKVIDFYGTQKELLEKEKIGATMRLGAYAAQLKSGTKVFECYERTGRLKYDAKRIKEIKDDFRLGLLDKGEPAVLERHRHRYEVNPEYIKKFEEAGVVFSGFHKLLDGGMLMEFMELPDHPFFVATQAHPEFKARLENPSPLFLGLIKGILDSK
ncbi:MAG: CTP synthetase, partial [candidate division WOR-3 bacterium]